MWSTAGTWTARRRRKSPPRSSRLQFDRHVVLHSPAQLGENVERLAEQPVALADRVIGGAVSRLLQDRGVRLDRLALPVTASVADRDGHSRGVADPLDLPRLLLADRHQAVSPWRGPDGCRLGPAVLGEGGQQDVVGLGDVGKGDRDAVKRSGQPSSSPSVSSSTARRPSMVACSGCAHIPRPAASSRRSAMPCSAHGLDSAMNLRLSSSSTYSADSRSYIQSAITPAVASYPNR